MSLITAFAAAAIQHAQLIADEEAAEIALKAVAHPLGWPALLAEADRRAEVMRDWRGESTVTDMVGAGLQTMRAAALRGLASELARGWWD